MAKGNSHFCQSQRWDATFDRRDPCTKYYAKQSQDLPVTLLKASGPPPRKIAKPSTSPYRSTRLPPQAPYSFSSSSSSSPLPPPHPPPPPPPSAHPSAAYPNPARHLSPQSHALTHLISHESHKNSQPFHHSQPFLHLQLGNKSPPPLAQIVSSKHRLSKPQPSPSYLYPSGPFYIYAWPSSYTIC